ncbi:unnamed protein product, partial [Mesorhabditis belari]|uniref:C-type lectin domain-containing protein n=1 Tax=Mesorhabditis belari TaxID=2138241 RepID=A0AAF3ENW5_9BILA
MLPLIGGLIALSAVRVVIGDGCACPQGFDSVSTLGLCVGSPELTGGGWDSNQRSCKTLGGDLVIINSGFYNTLVGAIALQNFAQSLVMIGAKRVDGTADWVWPDGSATDYKNWAPGNPPADPAMNCAYINGNDNTWFAQPCSNKNPYLCQFGASINKCLQGWTYNPQTDSCYYLGHDLSFVDAQAWCIKNSKKEHPGCLASIHDYAENKFIQTLAQDNSCSGKFPIYAGSTLVGGVYTGSRLNYWLDGTPDDYNNFCNVSVALDNSVMLLRAVGSQCSTGCGDGSWWAGIDSIQSDQTYPSFVCKSKPLCA